jgi:hypothetical protein
MTSPRALGTAGAWAIVLLAISAGPVARSAAADDPPPATAPPDTVVADPLDDYLDGLSARGDAAFDLEALSISDAEVDSLIRIWEATGDSPYEEPEPTWRTSFELGAVRYNRVEGLNVMPAARVRAPLRRELSLGGRAGYGWAGEDWTWRAGLTAELLRGHGSPTLELEHARDVYSYGSGGFPGNTIAAGLFGKDYDDYFRGEGWRAGLGLSPGRFAFDVGWRVEEQESLANETDWAVFERHDPFRPNPPIDPGTTRLVEGSIEWGDPGYGRFALRVDGAVAGRELGGDFDYETLGGRIVARKGLWFGDLATVELRGGAVTGNAPFQALPHLGGFQTLRGYEINEIPARRYAHFRLDYQLGTDVIGALPWLRHLRVQAVPFFDAAAVFESQARDGSVIDLDEPEVKASAGLGLQRNLLGIPGGAGQLRLDLSRRLDRGDDTFVARLLVTMQR